MLQRIVPTDCIESFPPPRRAICLEMMLLDDSVVIQCSLKSKMGKSGVFHMSGCAKLSKAGLENWTRKVFH